MAEQPMTRRERRDAERAAAAAAAAAQAPPSGSPAAGAATRTVAGLVVPAAPSPAPGSLSAATPATAPQAPASGSPAAGAATRAATGRAIGTGATVDRRRSRQAATASEAERPSTESPADSHDSTPRPAEAQDESVPPPSTSAAQASRRRGISAVGRVGILTLLAVATVLAPLSSQVTAGASGTAALGAAQGAQESTAQASSGHSTSVAAAVLGSDADVDSSTDTELSNVPDAATLARIRAAYENAAVTCAPPASGASGDTSAFTTAPEVFFPMVAGTYEISSPYGYRLHPTLGTMKLHAGQDYSAPVGTPMYAVAAGKVVTAGMVDGTGTVTIEHNVDGETWYTSYLHMYEDGIYVTVGDEVTAGQLIAGVGNTGRSTGAHLHFEVRTKNDMADSSTVDPQAWLVEHQAVELSTDCS